VKTAELKDIVRERERTWKESGIALCTVEKEEKVLEQEHAQLMKRRAHAEIVSKDLNERCVAEQEQEDGFKQELVEVSTIFFPGKYIAKAPLYVQHTSDRLTCLPQQNNST
jgi:hypothetical protein